MILGHWSIFEGVEVQPVYPCSVLPCCWICHHYRGVILKKTLSGAPPPPLGPVGSALMISERLNRPPNVTAFWGEGCLADDEAMFLLPVKTITRFKGMKVHDYFHDITDQSAANLLSKRVLVTACCFLRTLEQLLYRLSLSFYLERTGPCVGSYLSITVSWRWSCFSSSQFMTALIACPSRLMARIWDRTNTCCDVSPTARRHRPNSPYWHDEFDKSPYRPGRQLKRMWQGSLSPLSSCSASFRSHLSPLWISYF